MKRIINKLALSGFMALGMIVFSSSGEASAISTSGAAQSLKILNSTASSDLVEIKHHKRRWHRPPPPRRHWRGHSRRPSSGFYFEFGTGSFRYRPPVVVRPPLYAPPPVYAKPLYALPVAHVRWCSERYRSYRVSDNTFQPYQGPRKACRSPYWG